MHYKKHSFRKKFGPKKALFFLGAIVAFVLAAGGVVMILWNAILPPVLGVKPLNFWRAVGLFVLFKILFGGFSPRRWKRRMSARKKQWREKWMNMSEEERAHFKEKWKDHCRKKK